jgi:hypothetical protein
MHTPYGDYSNFKEFCSIIRYRDINKELEFCEEVLKATMVDNKFYLKAPVNVETTVSA